MRHIAAFILSLLVIGPASAHADAGEDRTGHTAVSAEDAFVQMKRMVGTWRPADKPQSSHRIRFYLTAGGTVLVESWEVRGEPHSLTLYHRDGETLLATHYCPQGNQPRLELAGQDASGLHFAFRDVTDLEPTSESHQHDLWIDLADPEHPVRSETYASKDGIGTRERLRLVSANEV
ncbi:hypothetical protein [Blastomonas sp.]|uniref:hypothetical protein n=1 Tax=Blastomonas sp. TaxID=1909299 RepID=UPI002605A6E9|nr:hypothetical protein [Blastomonas sp.]MDM7957822.1 hypothetical protein [Blastomonas sp.]